MSPGAVLALVLFAFLPLTPVVAQDAGSSAVFAAIRSGDHAGLREAVKRVKNLDLEEDRGETALKAAIQAGDSGAVDILLAAGASPNATGSSVSFRPPLSVALMRNDLPIVRRLLDAGAEIAFRDSFGYTMFDVAFKTQHGNGPKKDAATQDEVIRLLFDTMLARGIAFVPVAKNETVRCIDQALCAAARAGSVEWCRTFLDVGANPDAIELRMYTPLMCGAIGGSDAVLRLLLERNADPHIALTPKRLTALWYAVRGGKGAAVVLPLLERYPPNSPELQAPKEVAESVAAVADRWADAEVKELLRKAREGLPLVGAGAPALPAGRQ